MDSLSILGIKFCTRVGHFLIRCTSMNLICNAILVLYAKGVLLKGVKSYGKP